MNYRLAQKTDIDRLVSMAESAKAYFRENGIDQWQKGEPNAACMLDAIGRQEIYVLEEDGEVMAMITIVSGPEPSYAVIDGAWLNEEPYCAFHRVCVDSEKIQVKQELGEVTQVSEMKYPCLITVDKDIFVQQYHLPLFDNTMLRFFPDNSHITYV